MIEKVTLIEFLQFLATASGDEALEVISRFQSGGLIVEGMAVDDLEPADD